MKIVIVGAGAIGGYIGARLAKAGADVVLFARGPHLRAMQERGLRVISPDGDFEVAPETAGDLAAIGRADVIVLGVKAHALTALAPQLGPLLGPDTVVVSTQNGIPWWYFQGIGGELEGLRLEHVDPGGTIASAIDPRRVVGSLAYFSADVPEPGVIHHTEGNRISFGEPDGTRSDRCRAIASALIAAGFRCPVSTRFRHEIWVKLMGNVAFNPISALTGGTLEELARHPDVSTRGSGADGGNRGGGRAARHRAADFDRSADGRCGKSRGAQNVNAAGFGGRPADGNRRRRRRGRGAGGAIKRADAGHAGDL